MDKNKSGFKIEKKKNKSVNVIPILIPFWKIKLVKNITLHKKERPLPHQKYI